MSNFKDFSDKSGLYPATPIYVGDEQTDKIRVNILTFDPNDTNNKQLFTDLKTSEVKSKFDPKGKISWLYVDGVHQSSRIKEICKFLNIHPLVTEDILNTRQRPKIDFYDEQIMVQLIDSELDNSFNFSSTQVSVVISTEFVISFHEASDNIYERLKEKIERAFTRKSESKVDFVAYLILDSVVDSHFEPLERIEDEIENLEDDVFNQKELNQEKISQIYLLRKLNVLLRKTIFPAKDIVNSLLNIKHPLFNPQTHPYLRDLSDHVNILIDQADSNKELIISLRENYLTTTTNNLNSVMKTLTIISTTLMPLTLITSIYGMNFQNMPELTWHYGYFIVLGVMIAIFTTLIYAYKQQNWI